MAIQFNPSAAASQVVTNPFSQRGEDQLKTREDENKDRTQIRAQSTSAAESQKSETHNTRERVTAREDDERRDTQRRGSTVNITV